MKYIILASLLSSAALAAPFAQQGQQAGNANAGAANQQAGQAQVGQQQAGQQVAQGQTGQTAQGQAGQVAQGQTGQTAQGQAGQTQNVPTGGQATQGTPSAADLATAVSNWMADTSMVSNFLDTGKAMTNNVAFKQAATVAFNAEVDELNHKAIIDAANSADPNVIAANSTLATGGAFQDVVNKLQIMSQQGMAAVSNIDLINQNRCTNVLPNIDAYMASTGSQSRAVRPAVCDQTGIMGGVQSLGPTQPGGTPGTPQQAFDAASALAAGTGNGITPQQGNGAAAQTPAGAQTPAQGQAGAQTPAQGQAGAQTPAQGQAGAQTPAQGQAGAQTPAQGQAGQAQAGQQAQGQAGAQQGQQAQGQAGAQQGQQAQGQQAQGQAGAQQGQQAQGQAGAQQGQQAQGQAGAQQGQQQAGAQGQRQQGQQAQGQRQQAGAANQ